MHSFSPPCTDFACSVTVSAMRGARRNAIGVVGVVVVAVAVVVDIVEIVSRGGQRGAEPPVNG